MKNYIALSFNELVANAISNGIFVSDNKTCIYETLINQSNSDTITNYMKDVYQTPNSTTLIGLRENSIETNLHIFAKMKLQWSKSNYKRIYAAKNVDGNVELYDVSDIINAYAAIIRYQLSTIKQYSF